MSTLTGTEGSNPSLSVAFLGNSMQIQALFISLLTTLSFATQKNDVVIVGGGIVGLFEAYQTAKDAQDNNETITITVLEKHQTRFDTTTANIVPSLTIDEILAVVPRGANLIASLQKKFYEGEGIRVEDIDNESETVTQFIKAAKTDGDNENLYKERTKTLLNLGKKSMHLWDVFYQKADPELKLILQQANYQPCKETSSSQLKQGYRIDLLFNDADVLTKAKGMVSRYQALGYRHAKILSPRDVLLIDPFLKHFVYEHTCLSPNRRLSWDNKTVAVWRPGGCINTTIFVPKFIDYLEKNYPIKVLFGHEVQSLQFSKDHTIEKITMKTPRGFCTLSPQNVIFCPGEAVGTLKTLGFHEPPYAIFAGPSLRLLIEIPHNQRKEFENLNHCMEVHQKGVVLAWQAKYINGKVFVGVGGSKAFYGDKRPQLHEEFARNRNLFQLNAIHLVYKNLLSIALRKDVTNKTLNQSDLNTLIQNGIAQGWVGARAVAYDGFPTLGALYHNNALVLNARVTTHLGSGGVSCAFGAIEASKNPASTLHYFADSRR